MLNALTRSLCFVLVTLSWRTFFLALGEEASNSSHGNQYETSGDNTSESGVTESTETSLSDRICAALVDQGVINSRQSRICRRDSGLPEALVEAYRNAYLQCKKHFRYERWNCTEPAGRRAMLTTGYREQSFLVALTSASLAVSISKACDSGSLRICGCYADDPDSLTCLNSLIYGQRFARRFFRRRSDEETFQNTVNTHNRNHGIRMLNEISIKECRCHGISTSCAIRTCWSRTTAADMLGAKVKQSYDSAVHAADVQLEILNTTNRRQRSSNKRHPLYTIDLERISVSEMAYIDSSPNFCSPSNYSSGTIHRQCQLGPANGTCDHLCCDRGYHNATIQVTTRCRCRTVWCCNVVCEECTHSETIYRCN